MVWSSDWSSVAQMMHAVIMPRCGVRSSRAMVPATANGYQPDRDVMAFSPWSRSLCDQAERIKAATATDMARCDQPPPGFQLRCRVGMRPTVHHGDAGDARW